jgi:hypothetical protein
MAIVHKIEQKDSPMRGSFALSVGLILAVPTLAAATTAPLDIHHGTVRHHHLLMHRRVAEVQAMRPVQPMVFSSTQRVPHRVYEREGLAWNPSDCIDYGCIGNN